MGWLDRLTTASFRGVDFEVATDERSGGRDTAAHTTPGSNAAPYVEDTGLKGRVFTLEGYYVGDDCFDNRDALLYVLELEGSGDLVHPTYGVIRVSVQSYASKYDSRQGGMVTVSMTFIETTAEPLFVQDTLSPEGTVEAAASTFRDHSLAQFLVAYASIPYSAEISGLLTDLAQYIQQIAAAKVIAEDSAASLWRQTTDLTGDVAGLLTQPAALALTVRTLIGALATSLKGAVGSPPWTALLSLGTADYGEPPDTSTPEGQIAADSFSAMRSLVAREAIDKAAGVVTSAQHESHEDAVGARTAVTEAIDSYCEQYTDDTYDSMQGVRRALCQSVPSPDEALPHLEAAQFPGPLPSLVVSYTLYGDLEHEDGLLRRNGIEDPTFVPGGRPLEVLSR